MSNITDEMITEIIGDIDTSEEVPQHPSEWRADMHNEVKGIAKNAQSYDDLMADLGDLFAEHRDFLGGTDHDDNLSEAYRASDRRKQKKSNNN